MKNKNKFKLIVVIIGIIVMCGSLLLIFGGSKEKVGSKDDIIVTYEKGSEIKIDEFNKKYVNTITVENKSNEDTTYKFIFKDVKNTVKESSKFLYKVTAEDNSIAPEVGKSQMPGGELTLFPNVY